MATGGGGSRSRQEERLRLAAQIEEWNSNRLDLFAISLPTENLEIFGVMRFFYQDEGEKVSTKCVRVSNTATTKDVMGILIEKFRPDLRMLTRANYALYEVHVNGEERQLMDNEHPLLVQLNWGKDDREGRFLLKRETDKTKLVDCTSTSNQPIADGSNQSFKRKLSKREKKELKKKEKEQKVRGKENDSGVAERLYNELPESSFTRSISNPELVMRKRRQLKLEKKLQQIRSNDGGPDTGGTLKIYGSAVNPDVPYKTLLLAVTDNVAHVVKETLEKYGMEREDPDRFCLVQVLIPPDGPDYGKDPRERVLEDEECPLAILLQHPPSKGTIMYQLRPRAANMPKKVKSKTMDRIQDEKLFPDPLKQSQLPFLLQINSDGTSDPYNQRKISLPPNATEIGRERNGSNPKIPYIQLPTQDILPLHCVMNNKNGVVTVMPLSNEGFIYVNGSRISDPTVLRHGMVVQFGRLHQFRFVDATGNERKSHPAVPAELIQGPRGMTPKDFETTFDVDGRVETTRNQTQNERNLHQQQQQMLGPDPRFGPPGYEADLLPASLNVPEEVQEKFLFAIINDDNLTNIQFRMAPTYVVYMVVRSHVQHFGQPDASSNKQSWIVSSLTGKISQLICQKIKDSRTNPNVLSFWMANASEMLNFFKRDADVAPLSMQAQNLLAEAVQLAFGFLVDHMQAELGQAMPSFLNPRQDEPDQDADGRFTQVPSTVANVLQVLSSAMTVLRRCRVNAALTIQLFSQLFHFINMWIFNRIVLEPQLHLCTRVWGQVLRRRLRQVETWAEQQGLELAAECHLARVLQATFLLESPKTMNDVGHILGACDSLNSIQVQRILVNYLPGRGEAPIRPEVVEQLVYGSQTTVDESMRNEGLELRVDEPVSLQLLFLLPDDGYSCEFVKGVPGGLSEFVMPFVRNGICRFAVNQQSRGTWMIYMTNQEDMHTYQNLKSAEVQSDSKSPDASLRMEPEIITIAFQKVKNSLGLSIVAAKSESQKEKAIYVKSVVPGGGAALDGRIQTGDQLLEVDGKSLIGVSQEKAAEMMTQTGSSVTLKVAKQAAMFYGLSALLNQTQQPPNANWTKQNKDGGRMGPKTDSSSQPTLATTRPLNNEFRGSPSRPLNQQLEAKSTPALADMRYREQTSPEVDVYPGNYRPSPQVAAAQNVRFDPVRHSSSSQPDLVNRSPADVAHRDDFGRQHVAGPILPFTSGSDDSNRYSSNIKGARSSPNVSTQKGFGKPDDSDHQKILEWQQKNQMMVEREQWEKSRMSGGLMPDGARSLVGTRDLPNSMRGDFSSSGSMMSVEDERIQKLESPDTDRPAVKPILPYQSQQPVSKKGPGYATQMLFPSSNPARFQSPKDDSQMFPSNQPQGHQQGYQPTQQAGYPANKPFGYGGMGGAQPYSQTGGHLEATQSQAYGPAQPRNYPGSIPPQSGAVGLPANAAANQQSDYQPLTQFTRGYGSPSQDGSRMGANIPRSSPGDPEFPPPPSEMHLAQMGAQVSANHASQYGSHSVSVSSAAGSADATSGPYEPMRFPQGNRPVSSSSINQSSSVRDHQELTSSYLQRPRMDDVTSSVQNLGIDGYQSKPNPASNFPQPQAKKPPPVAAKPKITAMAGATSVNDTKRFSSSPWEEKDAMEKKMEEELRKKRIDEIKRLENRPYRSPEENSKLQRLLTEAEFDRRAQEASEDGSDNDENENHVSMMRQLNENFQSRQPPDRNMQQQEPMYAKVDKHNTDNTNRGQNDFQQGSVPLPGDFGRRQMDPQTAKTPNMDYPKSVSGPTGWQPSVKALDPGHVRYPNDDRKPSEMSDYASSRDTNRLPSGSSYSSNQNTEATRHAATPSGFPPQPLYSQSDYLYPASVRPNNDEFGSSGQSSSFGQSQPRMAGTVSALKQPDSQATGGTKKSVTFNENIGVNEYTINRSYGSTSSESSFPQSPEQSMGSRLSSDQPPAPPPATYLAAIRPSASNPPQQQYEPSYLQPSYSQHGRVAEQQQPSYPYNPSNEPRYPYGSQNQENSSRPSVALPYRPQDQSQFSNRNNNYAPDHRYPGQPSGGAGGGGAGGYYSHQPQPQYSVRPVQPLYSHSQEPVVYGRQQQMKDGSLDPAYIPGGGGASVIGAQEVYRDPRDRILASKAGPVMP